MTRIPASCAALVALACLCGGCGAPRVERAAEIERFRAESQARVAVLAADPAKPLTLADCEALAVKNNLAYRTRLLEARLTDEQVRLAMTGWLPRAELQCMRTARDNDPLVQVGGGPATAFEDQRVSRFGLHVLIPIFDFGTTYFAYQMAQDQRAQAQLAVMRARQTLLRETRVRYTRYAAELRQTELWQTAVKAALELLKVAQSMEREGLGAPADTAQVEALLAQAGRQLLLAQADAQEKRLLLLQTLSLPARTDFHIDQTLPALPPLPNLLQLAQLEDHALRARPELHVQDLARHIAATNVRREISGFFPRLDGIANFDWSSLSQQVNPAYVTYGLSVAHSLLESGSRFFRFRQARKNETVERERALLLAQAVLYEVDLNALQLARAHSDMLASQKVVSAQEVVLKQIESRFREGLETGAEAARAVAAVHAAMLDLDRARTDYLAAWHELQAAALPDEAPPGEAAPAQGPAEPPGDRHKSDSPAAPSPPAENRE
jgi:outer membrane protein TolC